MRPSASTSTTLNSRLLDYVFRRGAAEHAGGHYAANKQFIAPLPIRRPADDTLDRLGRELHSHARDRTRERAAFLAWLESALGRRVAELNGASRLARYDELALADVEAVLDANARRLRLVPRARAFRELLRREWEASVERAAAHTAALAAAEARADDAVYALYELTAAQRVLVDAEY